MLPGRLALCYPIGLPGSSGTSLPYAAPGNNRWQEITKISAEIHEIEMKKIRESMILRAGSLESLTRLTNL